MQFFHPPTILPFAAGALAAALAFDGLAQARDRFPIDIAAATAAAEQRFRDTDADSDGLISEQEFQDAVDNNGVPPWRGARQAEHSPTLRRGWDRGKRRAEAEHAEVKSSAERQRSRQRQFEVGDSNGDGVLTAEEYAALPEANRQRQLQRRFAGLDDNEDGMLSPEEFPNPARRLADLDVNGDGQVTRDEMPRRRQRQQAIDSAPLDPQ